MSNRTLGNKRTIIINDEIPDETRVSSVDSLIDGARAPQVEIIESTNLSMEINSNLIVSSSGLVTEPESNKSRDLEFTSNNSIARINGKVVERIYQNPRYELSEDIVVYDEDDAFYFNEAIQSKVDPIVNTTAPIVQRIVYQDIPDVAYSKDDVELIPNYLLPFIDDDECFSTKRVKLITLLEALNIMQDRGIAYKWLSGLAPVDYYPTKGNSSDEIMRKIQLHRNLRILKSWKRINAKFESKTYEGVLLRMHNTPYSNVHEIEQYIRYLIHHHQQIRATELEERQVVVDNNKRRKFIDERSSQDSYRSNQPAISNLNYSQHNRVIDQFGIGMDKHKNAIPVHNSRGIQSRTSVFEPGMDKLASNSYYLNESNNNVPQTMVYQSDIKVD